MKYTEPAFIPVASRWGLYYFPIGEIWDDGNGVDNAAGWFDMEIIGENHIHGSLPVNAHGYGMDIVIKTVEDLPIHSQPGIEIAIDITRPSLPLLRQRGEYVAQGATQPMDWNQDTNHFPIGPGWIWLDETFPFEGVTVVQIFGVSECYLFPEEDVGMASMNGVDAYIELDQAIAIDGGPFFFEADVRIRQDDFNAFLAPHSQNSVLGTLNEEGVYSSRRLELPDWPGFDVWFKYRLEFEWSNGLQLNYKAWIDDVVQDELTNPRVFLGFTAIGVRRLAGPAVWGDFDIKNLVFKRGSFSSPVVVLDMPLKKNALDIGPNSNHGTTFNMDLPSV
jgi:hypothetical protein